jgi:hypothetical protein
MVYVAAVQAITTLIIGLFAGYIAWRQWRTSQDRLVLDLFEKRFQVFQELTRTIAAAFQRVNVQISDLANFDAATEKARAAANHGNLPDQLDQGVTRANAGGDV